jgi:hypothetical protein
MAIKYRIELGGDRAIVGEYALEDAGFVSKWAPGTKAADVDLTATAMAMLGALVDDLLKDVRPLLPPAAPGRKVVTKRTAAGKIEEVTEYPPTAAPETELTRIRAHLMAQLAPVLLGPLAQAFLAEVARPAGRA